MAKNKEELEQEALQNEIDAFSLNCMTDFRFFAAACLKIKTKTQGIQPLVFNHAQIYLNDIVDAMIEKHGKVRVVIVKGRQQGLSTWIQGRGYHFTIHNPGNKAFILTHEGEATKNLFAMTKRYHENCPAEIRPITAKSNSSELKFSELDSEYAVGTAKTGDTGRSQTIQFFHGCLMAGAPVIDAITGQVTTIENISVGFHVRTHTGATAQVSFVSTQHKHCVEVTLKGTLNNPLGASLEHKFLTKDGMKKVKDFKAGERVGFPIRKIAHHIHRLPYGRKKDKFIDLDANFGALVGMYIDRGYIDYFTRRPAAICVTINECEVETFMSWVEPLRPLFDKISFSPRKPSNICVVSLEGFEMATAFIQNFGEEHGVRFPHGWWNMGDAFVLGLVKGHMLHTCYSSQPTRYLSVETQWGEVALQLRDMLASLGYGWADFDWAAVAEYAQIDYRIRYTLKLRGPGADFLAGTLGVTFDESEDRFEFDVTTIKDGYAWIPVVSVEPVGLQQVYDLEVDHEDHSYCLVQCASSNSEVAYWRAAKEISDGAMEGIPEEPGTEVYLESTAAGFGGYFHSMWQNGCYIDETPPANWNGYVRVFIPWFWEEKYTEPAPEHFSLIEGEQELKDLYDLTDDQIYWRRRKIANKEGNVAQFQREYPATPEDAFNSAVNNVLIPAALVVMARKRSVCNYYQAVGPVVMGVDVAREGDDSTALVVRQGRIVLEYYRFEKLDNMEVAGRVIRMARQWKVDFVGIDSTGGYGAGVYDRLAELGYGHMITAVNFASSAIDDEHFKNKRSEIWHGMKTWFETGAQIPDNDDFQQDLCSVTYKFDSSGDKLQLESKADMKKRGIKSPDLGDALALTFFRPSESMGGGQSFEPEHDY